MKKIFFFVLVSIISNDTYCQIDNLFNNSNISEYSFSILLKKELKSISKNDSVFIFLQNGKPSTINWGFIYVKNKNFNSLNIFIVDTYAKKYETKKIEKIADTIDLNKIKVFFFQERDTNIDINSTHATSLTLIYKNKANLFIKNDFSTILLSNNLKYLKDLINSIEFKYFQLLLEKLTVKTKSFYK